MGMDKILEKSKTDINLLNDLMDIAKKANIESLVKKCEDIKSEHFPLSEEEVKTIERVKQLNLLFRMVSLNVSEKTCYLIDETLNVFNDKDGDFSLSDASDIIVKSDALFDKL